MSNENPTPQSVVHQHIVAPDGCNIAGRDNNVTNYITISATVPLSPVVEIPQLPNRHFQRPTLVEQIDLRLCQSISTSTTSDGAKTCIGILLGPQGNGKTTLAAEWCRLKQPNTVWLDASKPGDLNVSEIPKGVCIVVDGLDHVSGNLLESRPWLAHLRGRILAVTSQPAVVDQLLIEWKIVDRKQDVVFELNAGFTNEECLQFLECVIPSETCNEFNQEIIKDLNQTLNGNPFFWVFVAKLVVHDEFPTWAEGLRNPSSIDVLQKTYYTLFAKWANLESSEGETWSVAYLLCCVSLIGTNAEALAFILQKDIGLVKESLASLQKLGFVYKVGGFDNYWLPHDLLRNVCQRIVNEEKLTSQKERYRTYFTKVIASESISSGRLHTLLDAWLLCVTNVFERGWFNHPDGRNEPFVSSYDTLLKQIDLIKEHYKKLNVHESSIAKYIAESASKLSCGTLVGACRLLAKSQSPNVEVARLLLLASEHDDSMAKAEALHAAAIHWGNQNADISQEGIHALRKRLEECENRTHDDHGTELEVCSVLGGLCILGSSEEALTKTRQADFQRRFPLAELSVFIFMLGHSNKQETLSLYRSLSLCGRTKARCGDVFPFIQRYLFKKGHNVYFETIRAMKFNPNVPLFLAHMASNYDFYNYVFSRVSSGQQISDLEYRIENF